MAKSRHPAVALWAAMGFLVIGSLLAAEGIAGGVGPSFYAGLVVIGLAIFWLVMWLVVKRRKP